MRRLRALLLGILAVLTLLAVPRLARADEDPASPPPAPAPADEPPPTGEPPAPHAEEGHATPAPVDAKAYAAHLREALVPLRAQVRERLEAKIEAAQGAQLERISLILEYVALAGFVLLLPAPLFLRRRFPGKTGLLLKYGVLAAFTFALAISLFAGALMVLRESQHALGAETNPKIAIIEGMFHALDDSAEDLAPLGPTLIEPTLLQVQGGSEEPVQLLLLKNLEKLHEDTTVFGTVAGWLRGLSGLMGLLPVILSFLAVGLFLRNFVPLMRDIVTLPARAASGEAAAGRRIVGQTFRQVGREMLVILCFVGALLVVTMLSGFILAHVVGPAMSALLWFLLTSFLYLQVETHASTGWLLASHAGVVVFLFLNLAIVTLASVFFLSKVQKVFRARFHEMVPLKAHARFWTWGPASLVWAEVLPLLFSIGAAPIVVKVFGHYIEGEHPSFLTGLLLSAAILACGLPLVFWGLRGVKALVFLLRYKRVEPAGGATATPKA